MNGQTSSTPVTTVATHCTAAIAQSTGSRALVARASL